MLGTRPLSLRNSLYGNGGRQPVENSCAEQGRIYRFSIFLTAQATGVTAKTDTGSAPGNVLQK